MKKILFSPWTKRALFVLCLIPALLLVWRGFTGDLSANPIEYIEHRTGDWALRFLLITLAVTPLRKILQRPDLIQYRRMLGLFAFFYGSMHLLTYLWLDQSFSVPAMIKDVVKRPFITAGMTGFLSMLPLAVTSTAGWIRRIGGRNWQRLHRLIYLAATAGVVHYYWLVKSDVRLPLLYAALLTPLLAWRLVEAARKRRPHPAAAAALR